MKTFKYEKLFLFVYAAVLVLLFLMYTTDWIIKEDEVSIFNVSVIVEDNKDDYYVNYKMGMEQAAIENNVDVSFITLYERNNTAQQEEMLNREINDGAQAVVLSPVEPLRMISVLESKVNKVPVISINNELPASNVWSNIIADDFKAGKEMAENIISAENRDVSYYLFTEGLNFGSNINFYDGIKSVLDEAGREVTLVEEQLNYGYEGIMKNLIQGDCRNKVLIAIDAETLVRAASYIKETGQEEDLRPRLYGRGVNMQILNLVDDGIIDGISTFNGYDMGYLSMEKAIEAIQKKSVKETITLEHYFMKRQDILKKEYEKMLFPIN